VGFSELKDKQVRHDKPENCRLEARITNSKFPFDVVGLFG
jgi:hypothetical protein